MRPITPKWVNRFLDQAQQIASWSKDPSTVVGCVVVRDRAVISTGYNGFPEGVEDTPDRYDEREVKYRYTVHAEQNAVYNAAKRGVSLDGAQMFVHGLPCCHECAKAVIQSGISKIWMRHGPMLDKWRDSFADTKIMFAEAGVEYECVEVGAGLSTETYWEPGNPSSGDEPVHKDEAVQEWYIRTFVSVDDAYRGWPLGLHQRNPECRELLEEDRRRLGLGPE